MKIEFEDAENVTVTLPCDVIDEHTGLPVESITRTYSIEFRVTKDPGCTPDLKNVETKHKGRTPDLERIAAGHHPNYRVDVDYEFKWILAQVEREWWNRYGADHFEYVRPTQEEPGYWR